MIGPVVHGPPIASRVVLIGQAPGPREGSFGRPFAWTAGKTLFRWFEQEVGIDEATFRERIYITAIARCFPGKAKGGGDRRPDRDEIARCGRFVARELKALTPRLIIPVGTLAIAGVLGHEPKLVEVIGQKFRAEMHGTEADVIALPHPSGASSWPKIEPGKSLLAKALTLLAGHPALREIAGSGAR